MKANGICTCLLLAPYCPAPAVIISSSPVSLRQPETGGNGSPCLCSTGSSARLVLLIQSKPISSKRFWTGEGLTAGKKAFQPCFSVYLKDEGPGLCVGLPTQFHHFYQSKSWQLFLWTKLFNLHSCLVFQSSLGDFRHISSIWFNTPSL